MKEVPKKDHEDVGGGTVYEPWRPPDLPFPQFPGCPTDPPIPGIDDPVYPDPTIV